MTRLSQVIAVEPDIRSHVDAAREEALRLLTHTQLLNGQARTYHPRDEEGETLPPETQLVQVRAEQVLAAIRAELTLLYDVTATRDYANLGATADVVIEGEVLLKGAPVVFLLWLEKQLDVLEKFVGHALTLDPSEQWTYDDAAGVWKTPPERRIATKKVPRVLVLVEPTKEHPAQTTVWQDDVAVGEWTKVRASGAVPAPRQREMLDRIRKLRLAVKSAREEANSVQVHEQKVGEAVLGYVIG